MTLSSQRGVVDIVVADAMLHIAASTATIPTAYDGPLTAYMRTQRAYERSTPINQRKPMKIDFSSDTCTKMYKRTLISVRISDVTVQNLHQPIRSCVRSPRDTTFTRASERRRLHLCAPSGISDDVVIVTRKPETIRRDTRRVYAA